GGATGVEHHAREGKPGDRGERADGMRTGRRIRRDDRVVGGGGQFRAERDDAGDRVGPAGRDRTAGGGVAEFRGAAGGRAGSGSRAGRGLRRAVAGDGDIARAGDRIREGGGAGQGGVHVGEDGAGGG